MTLQLPKVLPRPRYRTDDVDFAGEGDCKDGSRPAQRRHRVRLSVSVGLSSTAVMMFICSKRAHFQPL
jgi:hypothetical protein